jgi:addiction module HigA family antidote
LAANDSGSVDESTTPAWVLRERFFRPSNISQAELAKALGVSRPRLNQLLSERSRITAEMALRLGRVFGTSAHFWLEMQMVFDLLRANERLRDELEQLQPLDHLLGSSRDP